MRSSKPASVLAIALGIPLAALCEEPITGEALDRASAAALEYTGGGRVTETEVGDEDAYYEVEVTLADGRQVDVHLDADFRVVGAETDSESDEEGQDDDGDDG